MTLRTATGPSGHPVVVPTGVEVLGPFIEAGLFGEYEVQFAAGILRLQPGIGDEELLALAVAARAPRFGHVCTPLDAMAVRLAELDGEEVDDLPWPSAHAWAASLTRSSVVTDVAEPTGGPLRPLVWDGDRLYLHRYWHYELAIADDLLRRCLPAASGNSTWPGPDAVEVDRVLDSLFGVDGTDAPDLQRLAARRALGPGVSIIAGGPGTGKTYTVARLLAAAHLVAAEQGRALSVALAAPTGKAAARMGEAVQAALEDINRSEELGGVGGLVAATAPTTIHSLLGWEDRTHFRHDREHPLPEDMVIIDETSMVSLPLMAKLLDAIRPEASVVLVGDPYQLASIEAGTVMSDVVGPAGRPETSGDPVATESSAPDSAAGVQTLWDSLAAAVPEPVGSGVLIDRVTVLRTMRRFEGDSTIAALADAVRTGDRARALDLLEEGATDLRWVRPDDAEQLAMVTGELVEVGAELVVAAARGDGAGRPRMPPGGSRSWPPPGVGPTGWPSGPAGSSRASPCWSPTSTPTVAGTSGVRCWSPPTTAPTGCSTGTPGWW